MCLNVKYDTPKLAKRDIVCFKRLIISSTVLGDVKDGAAFTATIANEYVKGHISLYNGSVYFCTGNKDLDGAYCPDKKGHKYSWVLDSRVQEVIIDGAIVTKKSYVTPYQHTPVEIGKIYTSDLDYFGGEVSRGLHSFRTLRDAKCDGYGIFAKCIIPKGSLYYKGTFDWYDSYASNTLKYVKIV